MNVLLLLLLLCAHSTNLQNMTLLIAESETRQNGVVGTHDVLGSVLLVSVFPVSNGFFI